MSSARATSATNQKSVQDAKKKLEKFLKTVETVPVEELQRTADAIKAEAIAQTPYQTGKLESSVYVKVSASKTKQGINAGASARSKGGYNYAGIQHENEDYEHPIKGKAHYISDPFNHQVALMIRRIRRRLKW